MPKDAPKPEPKFKIGDKVRRSGGPGTGTIHSIRYWAAERRYTYAVTGFGPTIQTFNETTLRLAV